jgi:hypothetical protein
MPVQGKNGGVFWRFCRFVPIGMDRRIISKMYVLGLNKYYTRNCQKRQNSPSSCGQIYLSSNTSYPSKEVKNGSKTDDP